MKKSHLLAALFAALTLNSNLQAELITFGTSGNTFTIDFVGISLGMGSMGNAADSRTGYGAVPYEYRMGKYEISQDAITKATASGMANVTAGAWTGNQPAAAISWYEAAAFVNWLNTSTGNQAAYNLSYSAVQPYGWSMTLWSSRYAWDFGGENLYRHRDAVYFLPSENEWYKAAYYVAGASYYVYPTAQDSDPTAVASGTGARSAVYEQPFGQGPAGVDVAGGLSPAGTMGQGGNVFEWSESAFDGSNSSASEDRAFRGGAWMADRGALNSLTRLGDDPSNADNFIGFRVASVDAAPIPEPGTWAAMAIFAGGAAFAGWRRRNSAKVA
jgi:hypothetical protein